MTLITILICFALQRLANIGGWFKKTWFESYLKRLNPWLSKYNEWIGMIIIVVPILIIVGLLRLIFHWHLFGLFDLIITVLVLMLCIDARDLKPKLQPFFADVAQGNLAEATKAVNEITGEIAPQNFGELNRAVTKAIVVRSFECLFSVLFWFLIFGIYGAVIYFSIRLISTEAIKVDPRNAGITNLANKIIAILDWVPVRLLGFSYSIAGHFDTTFAYCYKHLWLPLKENTTFLIDSALHALDAPTDVSKVETKETDAAFDLLNRTLIIWIVCVVLFSVGYWL